MILMSQALPLERSSQPLYVISIAQSRPEKVEAFAKASEQLLNQTIDIRLKLMGTCQPEDEQRVELLRGKCRQLGLEQYVDFYLNASYREHADLLAGPTAGLHTMTDEHFGISVVEYMAAGAIPIGPKMDIVVEEGGQQTGFLASSSSDFAVAICNVFPMPVEERLEMASAARACAGQFSESRFDSAIMKVISPLLEHAINPRRF